MGNELQVLQAPQTGMVTFSEDQISLIKTTICVDSTNDELALFLQQCKRTGLDPFSRQIYAIKRWDSDKGRNVMGIQTSIDGFRLIADRSGKYAGQVGPFWCGEDGIWRDVWTDTMKPIAAKVGVLRADFKEPLFKVALWSEYVQTKKDRSPTYMWEKMGVNQLAKCAEALALRAAFPNDLSGLYTADEMGQATNEAAPKDPRKEVAPEPPESVVEIAAILADIYTAGKPLPEASQERIQADIDAAGNDLDALAEILEVVRESVERRDLNAKALAGMPEGERAAMRTWLDGKDGKRPPLQKIRDLLAKQKPATKPITDRSEVPDLDDEGDR